jgi:hypothetical protein
MNSAPVPLSNPNWLAPSYRGQLDFLEGGSHGEASPQSFAVNLDCQFAGHDRANEKDYFDCHDKQKNASISRCNDSCERN